MHLSTSYRAYNKYEKNIYFNFQYGYPNVMNLRSVKNIYKVKNSRWSNGPQ